MLRMRRYNFNVLVKSLIVFVIDISISFFFGEKSIYENVKSAFLTTIRRPRLHKPFAFVHRFFVVGCFGFSLEIIYH